MAFCETTHWTLDCGDGHACYLAEYSDTGALAGWGCNSTPVKGRAKLKSPMKVTQPLEFCCTDITLAGLAEALDDLVDADIVVPKGRHRERVSYCSSGTLHEIMGAVGLTAIPRASSR